MVQLKLERHLDGHDDLVNLRKATGIDYLMQPRYIAGYLFSEISPFVRKTYLTASFGGILYE